MDLMTDGPYYDEKGVEIETGDLLKVYHYRSRHFRRKEYMYHIAILQESKGKLYWAAKDYNREGNVGHYWLMSVAHKASRIISGTEIIKKPKWESEEKLKKEGRKRIRAYKDQQKGGQE